jgi:MFS family permease
MLLFVARAFVLMAFTITYLYTPEIYAQHLRALGVAVANAFARVGGMIAPFIGQSLVQSGQVQVTEIVFAVVCGLAMVCALLVQVETSGASLGAPTALGASSGGAAGGGENGSRRHPGRGLVSSDLMLHDEAVSLAADGDSGDDAWAAKASDVSASLATGDHDADGISLAGIETEEDAAVPRL